MRIYVKVWFDGKGITRNQATFRLDSQNIHDWTGCHFVFYSLTLSSAMHIWHETAKHISHHHEWLQSIVLFYFCKKLLLLLLLPACMHRQWHFKKRTISIMSMTCILDAFIGLAELMHDKPDKMISEPAPRHNSHHFFHSSNIKKLGFNRGVRIYCD